MTSDTKMRVNVACAALAGLALRLLLVFQIPMTEAGDSPLYIALAWNWLKRGVYGVLIDGRLTPLDARAPGYPAFLAAIFACAGNSSRAVMLVQALLDVATCFLIALIAARLVPEPARRRVALAGLWLAALCPFTANYTAVVLTETLTLFLTALAILVFLEGNSALAARATIAAGPATSSGRVWLLTGLLAGFAALVRPESPLLLLAAGMVLVAAWWRPADWRKLACAGVLMGVGLVLPLLPWAARNWRTLHEVQFLAPRYVALPGDVVPRGFNAWTNTWLWRFADVYLTQWKLNSEEIRVADISRSAFDSAAERARVAHLLAEYNRTSNLSAEQDAAFGEIARERTARHPLRTYLEIPLLRSLALWFTPRSELLPHSGHLGPLREEWEDDREDFLITWGLFLVNGAYLALGLAGAWIARRRPGWALLIAFLVVRTAFFANFVETPEPRYVLECFPAVIAFAAQLFSGSRQASSTGSG